MYRAKVARVRHEPAPLQCATFKPLPGRVLTTVTIEERDSGETVLIAHDLEHYELREALPALDGIFPRGEYRYTLNAKVVQP